MTIEQKLERLHNRQTKYELIAQHPDGRKLLVRYCRQGRRGLWDAITKDDGTQLCRVLGADHIHFAKRAADGGTMGEWTIRFSGRTQRQAIMEGEYPFYADLDTVAEALESVGA